jgi:hypothetical protein
MICRFPGCSKPADECDTDHTIPWPYGRTHPSNTKPYCRHHHLLKTFWTGPGGFHDIQHPDGTVEFTSPSGRRYRTKPLGALFFPQLAAASGGHVPRGEPPPKAGPNGANMPRRRRSRAADRAARIAWERGVNRARLASLPPPPF